MGLREKGCELWSLLWVGFHVLLGKSPLLYSNTKMNITASKHILEYN